MQQFWKKYVNMWHVSYEAVRPNNETRHRAEPQQQQKHGPTSLMNLSENINKILAS